MFVSLTLNELLLPSRVPKRGSTVVIFFMLHKIREWVGTAFRLNLKKRVFHIAAVLDSWKEEGEEGRTLLFLVKLQVQCVTDPQIQCVHLCSEFFCC